MSPQTMGKLAKLHEGIRSCVKCPLYQSRTHAVPGEGDPQAAIMLVGEAPGRVEDREGRPFVGPSGRFLITLLERNGLSREAVFITNSVKCRPPNNRSCTPPLHQQPYHSPRAATPRATAHRRARATAAV
jgi:uracil-DNA glycosylase